jgi:hypothetical protein
MDMQVLVPLVNEHTNNMPILFYTYMLPFCPFSSSHTVLSRIKMAFVLLQITRVYNSSSHWPQHAHNGSIHMKDVSTGVFKVPL